MIAGLAVAALLAGQAAPDLQRYEYRQRLMGVEFKLALYAPSEPVANAAAKAAFTRVKRLNRILSDYEPESELMTLCANSGPGKPVKVSPELLFVLSRAQALSKRTGGAFDVTVGHLTRLWRNARRRRRFPKPEDIAKAKQRTGFQHVRIDPKKRTVELRKEGMRLDLGGIAKGYAGDEALRVLRKHGVTRAMIDASGDIVVGDAPPGKRGWTIAIAGVAAVSKPSPLRGEGRRRPGEGAKSQGSSNPSPRPSPLSKGRGRESKPREVLLRNCAIATSGDAYQYVEFDGKRYSHIVDPKTGLGVTRRGSVTVIAPTGWQADSLASAVSVLGPDRGVLLSAGQRGVEISVTIIREGERVTTETCGFRRYSNAK